MKKLLLLVAALLVFTGAESPFGKKRGVFIEEIRPANRIIRGVSTGVPVFIGYTAASADRRSIRSSGEYQTVFGGPAGPGARYALYESIKLFFDNGGAECVVVSAGRYGQTPNYRALYDALQLSRGASASIVCVPDAVYLAAGDFFRLQGDVLALCRERRDRFAILDTQEPTGSAGNDAQNYRSLSPGINASWGAAYYPWLVLAGGKRVPPCGAVAGIYSAIDASRGVWKTPANIAVRGTTGLTTVLDSSQQADLQMDGGGVSINAIRAFSGKGPLVYGGRTLAGNDNEWRYVSVRRLMIYFEQSIAAGVRWAALEPNNAKTWTAVRASAVDFLTQEWKKGALQGSKPDQAFIVKVGLGETMTAVDVNNGVMIIEIGAAAVRPSEFIILRITLPMSAR